MLSQLVRHIHKEHLLAQGEEVLLAVSGGRDSVVMAHLFHRAAIPFAIAHCNFHLRPSECDRDQALVTRLADQIGVKLHVVHFDTRAHAASHHQSIEEAARQLRYDYFASLCAAHGYAAVATAHHADDSIETFFLNLFRGTGLHGLRGIAPSSQWGENLRVIHPMLCFTRQQITDYCTAQGLAYADDSTNFLPVARRNQLRLQLLPLVEQLYPAYRTTLLTDMQRLADADHIYQSALSHHRSQLLRPYDSLLPTAPPMQYLLLSALPEPRHTLLYELLHPYGFAADTVAQILSSPRSGALFHSPTHTATLAADPEGAGLALFVVQRFAAATMPVVEHRIVEGALLPTAADACCVSLDADCVALPLALRPWHSGDRFCPLGMEGSRLVSDFLKDLHLNRLERQHLLLLTDSSGAILWLVGLRLDHRFRLTPTTRRTLCVEVKW